VGTFVLIGVVSLIAVFTLFEVHFEKRSFHRQLRKEEHHAATKLAHVEMELWAQYREDIMESKEAHAVLKSLNASYDTLQGTLQKTIEDAGKELNLNKDKAASLANKVIHLVAKVREDNLKHTKHLMDHLMKAGKKSVALEKHVQREIEKDVEAEEKQILEDEKAGEYYLDDEKEKGEGANPGHSGNNTELGEDEDPLKVMLDGFWATFDDYEGEFSAKTRPKMTEDNPVYKQLTDLHARITSSEPPSEEEVITALDKIDLAAVDIGLGSGRVLPAQDIVEELVLIPKIPHKELSALEKDWKAGKVEAFAVAAKLVEWHRQGLVPSGWWEQGVGAEETEEEKEEELEEKRLEKEETEGGRD